MTMIGKPAPTATNTGSLLRLFQSEFFDVHLHMHYLLSMESGGVQDYLVNALYRMSDDDVDFYLPQLCQMALLRFQKSALYRFLLDKASKSMHFALKITWLMQSYADDRRPEIREPALSLVQWCEEALLSGVVDGDAFDAAGGLAGKTTGAHSSQGRRSLTVASAAGDLEDGAPPAESVVTAAAAAAAAAGSSPTQSAAPAAPRRLRRARSCPELAMQRGGGSPAGGGEVENGAEDQEVQDRVRRQATTPTGAMLSRNSHGDPSAGGAGALRLHGAGAEGASFGPRRDEEEEEDVGEQVKDRVVHRGSGASYSRRASAPVMQVAEAAAEASPASCSSTVVVSTRGRVLRQFVALSEALSSEQWANAMGLGPSLPNAYVDLGDPVVGWMATAAGEATVECHMCEMGQFMAKQLRKDFYHTQRSLVSMITKLTGILVATAEKEERKARLKSTMRLFNRWLFDRRVVRALSGEGLHGLLGVHLPCLAARNYQRQILHVHADECKVFSSATRAPFLLVYETAILDDEDSAEGAAPQPSEADASAGVAGVAEAAGVGAAAKERGAAPAAPAAASFAPFGASATAGAAAAGAGGAGTTATDRLADCLVEELRSATGGSTPSCSPAASADPGAHPLWKRLTASTPEDWLAIQPSQRTRGLLPGLAGRCQRCPHAAAWADIEDSAVDGAQGFVPAACASCPQREQKEQAAKARAAIWGTSWDARLQSIRRSSPYGHYSSWALNAVVVKGGDDLRQELLASQVIKQFSAVFKEAKLPLWLKEIEVLVTSSSSGCIEFLADSMSVTGIKKMFPERALADLFQEAFADNLFRAKRNFIESYAAYSLVVWFLQVKDRHNDNLMMLSSGHVVHLDFGFMLSNSPGGNMGFEQSPFKLTQEFLDVMGGAFSDEYEYFRTLVVRGFLEARKHVDRIVLPIRMLLASGSRLPCFRDGMEWILQTLQDRFYVSLTEEACIEKILELIDTSVNHWSTVQYDMYQKMWNGIV